ncbi:MAG TPA: L-serine ammonia-lyase, iron-sulfur-dependent, subunit alpha [Armatimonadota bacterium]|nr:L-serine ammonia-lyase, iron-sulfur-dependent, subunit alpha [Armatimonadota bacterium]
MSGRDRRRRSDGRGGGGGSLRRHGPAGVRRGGDIAAELHGPRLRPSARGCEIPCHTRNAVAASSAFVCADLIMGGYENPIPLDETIDAVMSVGRMMARELRCTALGGIAATPSARALGKN